MELELREELDLVQAKVREAERARNTAYEIIADHEATIQKFRSLVSQVNYLDQLVTILSDLQGCMCLLGATTLGITTFSIIINKT
jgi:hypothetical protein